VEKTPLFVYIAVNDRHLVRCISIFKSTYYLNDSIMSEEKLKYRDWTPNYTNQVRLRHLRQICARCISQKPRATAEVSVFYYTLHVTIMSAPFYTSETLPGENIDWNDIDCRKFPENIVTACPGVVVRLWAKDDSSHSVPELITTWGVYFSGLVYMGSQLPKESALFLNNSLIFGTSWGYFVSEISLQTPLPQSVQTTSSSPILSYTIPTMSRIHRMQRAIYKEGGESDRLRQEIQLVQSNPLRFRSKTSRSAPPLVSSSPGDQELLQDLRARRQIAIARVSLLVQERTKQSRLVDQLKEALKNLRVDNHSRALHLKEKHFHLQMDKDRLSSLVKNAAGTEELLIRAKQHLSFRRRQLFEEMAGIFPIVQVKEDVYSINNVILPNSDSFSGCDDSQLSVALGHVCHLVQMISIVMQVPNRYPVSVWSSHSSIVDQVNQRDAADTHKRFPLYPKGKDRLYFEYAVYLLNKDIAQLRWMCGFNTGDLAATLPNLSALIQHLLLPPRESVEDRRAKIADKATSAHRNIAAVSAGSPSTHHGFGGFKSNRWPQTRGSRSLAGSHASVNTLPDQQSLNWSISLDRLTDSPQTTGYFRQAPSHQLQQLWMSSSTMSLDLAVDRLRFATSSPLQRSVIQHHGSAPDLCAPDPTASTTPTTPTTSTSAEQQQPMPVENPTEATVTDVEIAGTVPSDPADTSSPCLDRQQYIEDDMLVDDVMSSVSARTEALANTCSTFKLKGRGRHTSHSNL